MSRRDASRASRFARERRRPPAALLVLGGLGLGFLALPLLGLLWRAPWSELPNLLTSSAAWDATRTSIVVSLSATAICVVLGVPLAWVLTRVDFPGRRLARAAVLLPLVLPPVVGGVALLFTLGRRGLAGQYLDDWFGITLPFTTAGAVIAASFVALPFVVLAVEGALQSVDPELENAAATLGAGRWTRFRRVTLPLVAPGVLAGAALAWARALGEFGATITFAGSVSGETETLPLAVVTALNGGDTAASLALSLLLLIVSLVVLVALRDRWWPAR